MNSLIGNNNSSVSAKFFKLSFLSNKNVDNFYRKQSNLLEKFENDSKQIQDFQNQKKISNLFNDDSISSCLLQSSEKTIFDKNLNQPKIKSLKKIKPQKSILKRKNFFGTKHLALITLIVNIILTFSKTFASYLSGSLSIMSSLVDSLVDITSGLVIWLTTRAIYKHDPYLYPIGRKRLEPIALIIVSVIMGVASIQMILQSLESIIKNKINPNVDLITLCIMIITIVSKFLLFLACFRSSDSSIKVLALDHRNDCLSNFLALICAFLAEKTYIYLDPIGAILVALYIAITWFQTGKEQLKMLSGRSAKPEFINRIIKLCIDHDDRVNFIDTVYVYHFGTQFLVEVHIVLDKNMSVKDSHDISEALQNCIESLDDVERAFVHVDYEFNHKPQDEHKFP